MRVFVTLWIVALFLVGTVAAAPRSKLIDERWTRSGSGSVDHGAWREFLEVWTRPGADGITRVAYGEVDPGARRELGSYIRQLRSIDPVGLSRDEQFAYWVNLYNAATVALILEHFPVDSIRKIGGGFFSRGPWDDKFLMVAGRSLSLNDIEHGILRPVWRDPRIHYVVNCASIGCPNIGLEPFPVRNSEAALDAAAHAYINHPRGSRIEASRLILSSIYEWYAVDFGDTDQGVIAHLRQYADPPLLDGLKGVSRIAGYEYDWSLNGIR